MLEYMSADAAAHNDGKPSLDRSIADAIHARDHTVDVSTTMGQLDATSRVPGIDTTTALARLRGDNKLYTRLVRNFLDEQTDAIERVTAAYQAGEHNAAITAAHSQRRGGEPRH